MGVNYGMNKVRFMAPVKSGKRVRGRFTLLAVDRAARRQLPVDRVGHRRDRGRGQARADRRMDDAGVPVSRLPDAPARGVGPALRRRRRRHDPAGRQAARPVPAVRPQRPAWEKFSGGALTGRGPLTPRQREITILRTAARTGGEFEWTTHATMFAEKAGFTPAQVRSTFDGTADDGNWNEAEAVLIATVDALLDRKKLSAGRVRRASTRITTRRRCSRSSSWSASTTACR